MNKKEQPVRIAQITCGAEYSGIQNEITSAAETVVAKMFYPDVALKDVKRAYKDFGLPVKSPDLKLAIARAQAIVEGRIEADGIFIASCFRCAEAAIVRNELRRYIIENSKIPVVSYSFNERTGASTLPTWTSRAIRERRFAIVERASSLVRRVDAPVRSLNE